MIKLLKSIAFLAGAFIMWIFSTEPKPKRRICSMCGLEGQVYFIPENTYKFLNNDVGRYLCMKCMSRVIEHPVVVKVMEV